MPGPNSHPIGGKSAYVRQHKGAPHGEGCPRLCVHAPTKRARKIAARKTGVSRVEWIRKRGR
jgi:hypothetical protein